MYGWGLGHYGGWLGWLGPIFMVIFWALVITGMALLIRYLLKLGRNAQHEGSALEILKKRYAKGEIGKEEYEEKRKELL